MNFQNSEMPRLSIFIGLIVIIIIAFLRCNFQVNRSLFITSTIITADSSLGLAGFEHALLRLSWLPLLPWLHPLLAQHPPPAILHPQLPHPQLLQPQLLHSQLLLTLRNLGLQLLLVVAVVVVDVGHRLSSQIADTTEQEADTTEQEAGVAELLDAGAGVFSTSEESLLPIYR